MESQPERFLSEAQRRNFERGHAKGKAEGHAKGKAEGQADALLKVLKQRGLTPTPEQRRRIVECTDLAVLDGWLTRALSVKSLDELLVAPSRGTHRRTRRASANGRRKSR